MKHLTLFITTLPLLLPLASQTEGAEGTKVIDGLTLQYCTGSPPEIYSLAPDG